MAVARGFAADQGLGVGADCLVDEFTYLGTGRRVDERAEPGSMPQPTTRASIRSAGRLLNSPTTLSRTYRRFAAVKASPMLRIFAGMAPSTARSEVGALAHDEWGRCRPAPTTPAEHAARSAPGAATQHTRIERL
ncbi:hypothetical protein [Streptomyces sp900116325]|uniref:HTH araC/xylS-type domain-containing protein n=1 Tax=Streptomyces sp. 900116325 TaxID=3154295 RepID=A0ABV2UHT8_9ACTN